MGGPDLRIRDIQTKAIDAPLARPITTAAGTIPSAPLVLIDVITDQGIVGHSYLFGYSTVTLRPLVGLLSNLSAMLRGKPIAPARRMRDFDSAFRLLGKQGLLGMAISGLDMAFWDALGRAHDVSVARLLGGEDIPIPAYDSYGIVDPERDADFLVNSVDQGFKAIKIKIGSADWQTDVRTVSAVREIIGESTRLMVDYNQSLSVPEAINRIKRLAEFDIHWVEEPVPAEDLSGHATVRAASQVAIQTGENWWFPEDAACSISAGASDFAMLDLMKIGGFTGWMRAAGQAAAASLPVSSHIFLEASAHALAVTPSGHYLEYLDVASTILNQPVMARNGAVSPVGPGLGIEWNPDAVNRYAL